MTLTYRTQTSSASDCASSLRPPIGALRSTLACTISLVVFAGLPVQADAALCKYVDHDGRITYSNLGVGPRGASKMECFHAPAPAVVEPAPTDSEPDRAAIDAEQRRVLEEQLADEEERLQQAQDALAAQEANLAGNNLDVDDAPYYGWLGPYVDSVTAHRRRRDHIRHELGMPQPSHHAHQENPMTRPPRGVSSGVGSMHGWPALGSGAQRPEPEGHEASGIGLRGGRPVAAEPESRRR